jgi:hypothetical protein
MNLGVPPALALFVRHNLHNTKLLVWLTRRQSLSITHNSGGFGNSAPRPSRTRPPFPPAPRIPPPPRYGSIRGYESRRASGTRAVCTPQLAQYQAVGLAHEAAIPTTQDTELWVIERTQARCFHRGERGTKVSACPKPRPCNSFINRQSGPEAAISRAPSARCAEGKAGGDRFDPEPNDA